MDNVLIRDDNRKPWMDAESPRTRDMWQEYDRTTFPTPLDDGGLVDKMCIVFAYARKAPLL